MSSQQKPKASHVDPFEKAVIYRLRRDALMLVTNSNRNSGTNVSNAETKRKLIFYQSQLCSAAIADPTISAETKDLIVKFQAETIQANLDDRRGSRRRSDGTKQNLTQVRCNHATQEVLQNDSAHSYHSHISDK